MPNVPPEPDDLAKGSLTYTMDIIYILYIPQLRSK